MYLRVAALVDPSPPLALGDKDFLMNMQSRGWEPSVGLRFLSSSVLHLLEPRCFRMGGGCSTTEVSHEDTN